jgi:uncharacterized protein YjbI with pentapeptide repeats
MLNEDQLKILKQGIGAWNKWRRECPDDKVDLSGAILWEENLSGANLSKANLVGANFVGADLHGVDFKETKFGNNDFSGANLSETNLENLDLKNLDFRGSKFHNSNLNKADFRWADLRLAEFDDASLVETDLREAKLQGSYFNKAHLYKTKLARAFLIDADLRGAILDGTDLSNSMMFGAHLEGATIVDCRVSGVSAWNLKLDDKTEQRNLIITTYGQPAITVDNLEVAQFIYLLLHNEKIRSVIDTITSKVVLILGRFTPERKAILDVIKEELRNRNYLSVLFDFEGPISRTKGETVSTLAHMARFVIADITDARSISAELERIVKTHPSVPVKPIILKSDKESDKEYALFEDIQEFNCVLDLYRYIDSEQLIASIQREIIGPSESKAEEIQQKRLQNLIQTGKKNEVK